MNTPGYHPFPPEEHRIDPFDTSVEATQLVVLSGGIMSHAYRAPKPGAPGFGPADLVEAVPMGYTILRHAQKIAVIRGGRVLRAWPRTVRRSESNDPRERAWLDGICGYVIFDDRRYESGVRDRDDYRAALAQAVKASSTVRGTVLLLYVYAAQDWH
ncbi:hypothetical protein [Embleya sp. NPDC001921]